MADQKHVKPAVVGEIYNISNDVGRVKVLGFMDFEHTFHVSAHALVPFERVMIFLR